MTESAVDRVTCTVVDGHGATLDVVVRTGRPVLDSMPRGEDAPIQVGCRGGGCGVCRVEVLDGAYTTKRMSRRFVSEADELAGYALACRLLADADLTVRWDPLPARPR